MTNNNEIEKRLWEAADQLRANSGLKYSQFARPILGLIFLKYADYKFTQAQKELEKTSKAEPEKGTMDAYIPRRKKVSPSDYQSKGVVFLPENAQYSYILNLPESENIGKALNDVMKAIEKENEDLKGVLDIEYSEIEDSVLIALLKLFSEIDFRYNDDIFGIIYEYFLGEFAMGEGQRGGEFFTPESIVKLIIEILEPKKGRIYDPACGSGGMFVQSANYVKRLGKIPMNEISVFGQEKTLETVKLCKMNLAVHSISGDISQGNTYYEDIHNSFQKFDYVMANPPFNVNGVNKEKIGSDSRYSYGIPATDNANYLWIQIFCNAMNKNGRAGFVMANTSYNAGGSELEIRKKIISDKKVNVIIALSSNLFHNVSLPCSLWFFDNKKKGTDREDKILFIYARNIFFQKDRAHRLLLDNQINFIANLVRLYRKEDISRDYNFDIEHLNLTKKQIDKLNEAFSTNQYFDISGLCKVENINKVKARNWSLNPGRYVGITERPDDYFEISDSLERLNVKLEDIDEKLRKLSNINRQNIRKLIKGNFND